MLRYVGITYLRLLMKSIQVVICTSRCQDMFVDVVISSGKDKIARLYNLPTNNHILKKLQTLSFVCQPDKRF